MVVLEGVEIADRWFYDELIEWYTREADVLRKEISVASKKARKFERKIPDWDVGSFSEKNSQRYSKFHEYKLIAESANQILESDTLLALRQLRNYHVFLIGPATLDSLINAQPRTYEYIRDFKLPFDEIFFEFLDPFEIGLPFAGTQNVMALTLHNASGYDAANPYFIRLICSPRDNRRAEVEIIFNPESKERFIGIVNEVKPYNMIKSRPTKEFRPDAEENLFLFRLDMDSRTVRYSGYRELFEMHVKRGIPIMTLKEMLDTIGNDAPTSDRERLIKDYLVRRVMSLDQMEHRGSFYQIANLCVNLVNYINSHNTTVVERTIPIVRRTPREEHEREDRPFYVVIVKDKVVEEYEPREDQAWTLNERIYIRGHNRLYRHERYIKTSSWVDPYIKGPEDAPFRNQRHLVLAEKLLREQAMLRSHGIE